MADKKIAGFKKFSDMKSGKEELEEVNPGIQPSTDSNRPMLPNLPNKSTKTSKMASRLNVIPFDQNIADKTEDKEDKSNENKDVKLYGKIAKFPKKTKASKGLNFLENVKISKSSIWYLLIEKQDNELQMVKYNNKRGVDLGKFMHDLKSFYIDKYKNQPKVVKLIESIELKGANEFSSIGNIPNIEVDGKKLISKITEDLIKLLSK